MRPLTLPWFLLAVCLCAPPAPAQKKKPAESAETQAASKAFKQARERFDAKDYAAALEYAEQALAASGSPNARLYVGRSLRELNRLDEAHQELERTLREARVAAEKDPKYVPTRDAAAAELALLDQRVGKVVVAVVDAPAGARVELNGKVVANEKQGQPIAVIPGDLVLRGSADGVESVEKRGSIKAGETQTLTLVFRATETEKPRGEEPAAPATEPVAPKKRGGGLRTAGYVTVGVGVLGLGAFAVAGSMASSKFSELEDECGSKRCTDPKYADTVDSGKRLDTIANIGLAVGGVGVLAGSAMILFGGPSTESGTAAIAPSAGGATLHYLKRF